jgi:hypothetical protein
MANRPIFQIPGRYERLMMFIFGESQVNMGVRAFLSLSFLLLTAPPLLNAAGPATLNTPELMVVYDKGLEQTAQQILRAYPTIKQKLESMFQWPVNFRPSLVLINNQKRFQELAGNELVVAYALPKKNVVVIDYSKMNTG